MANSFPTARLTLGQMRRSAGHLTAAGVAILISMAFVTVTPPISHSGRMSRALQSESN